MSHGRKNTKARKSGFEKAAQALTKGLSEETASSFTDLVKETAERYFYNDSAMLRSLQRSLAAAAKKKEQWAVEVLMEMERKNSQRVAA